MIAVDSKTIPNDEGSSSGVARMFRTMYDLDPVSTFAELDHVEQIDFAQALVSGRITGYALCLTIVVYLLSTLGQMVVQLSNRLR